MKKAFFVTIVVIILTMLILQSTWSANPADLTSDYRSTGEFYKVAYDDGPRCVFANLPINPTVNASILNWQNATGEVRTCRLLLAKKFSDWLDGAVDATYANGGSLTEDVVFDLHWRYFGLGLILPLEYGGSLSLGPRLTIKSVTAYATTSFAKDSANCYGISGGVKGIKLEVAYGGETWFLRACKGFKTRYGTFFPESRNKFSSGKNVFGVALGFMPPN